jgi:hypothetical protein
MPQNGHNQSDATDACKPGGSHKAVVRVCRVSVDLEDAIFNAISELMIRFRECPLEGTLLSLRLVCTLGWVREIPNTLAFVELTAGWRRADTGEDMPVILKKLGE